MTTTTIEQNDATRSHGPTPVVGERGCVAISFLGAEHGVEWVQEVELEGHAVFVVRRNQESGVLAAFSMLDPDKSQRAALSFLATSAATYGASDLRVLCDNCGWVGHLSELGDGAACPMCGAAVNKKANPGPDVVEEGVFDPDVVEATAAATFEAIDEARERDAEDRIDEATGQGRR